MPFRGYNSFASYWHAGGYEPYGTRYHQGDVVGVYVNFDEATLTFYVNGKCLLAACQDSRLLEEPLFLAASIMNKDDAVTLLPPQPCPPSLS